MDYPVLTRLVAQPHLECSRVRTYDAAFDVSVASIRTCLFASRMRLPDEVIE